MTTTTTRPPVLLVHGDPAPFGNALGGGWTPRSDRNLPRSPWDLSDRRWAWVDSIGDVETAARAVDALSRGVGLVVSISLLGRDRHRLLEDLYALGDVRSSENAAPILDDDQRALMELLAAGITLTAAADQFHLSRRTANRRLAEIRTRLGVATTTEAIAVWPSTR